MWCVVFAPQRHGPASTPSDAEHAADGLAHVAAVRKDAERLRALEGGGRGQLLGLLQPVHAAREEAAASAKLRYGRAFLGVFAATKALGFMDSATDLFKYCASVAPLDGAIFIGEVARIVHVLAQRLGVTLRYPLTVDGPRSGVSCTSLSGIVEWLPLLPDLSGTFQRAVKLLSYNTASVCAALGVPTDAPFRDLWLAVNPALSGSAGSTAHRPSAGPPTPVDGTDDESEWAIVS